MSGSSPRPDDWIRAHVEPVGAAEVVHDLPWSTVLRVPTADGAVFFKENIEPLAYEARVVALLAERCPDRVTELVAIEPARGWLLMRDAGSTLRELAPSEAHWRRLLRSYAELQLAVAPDADELVAAGAPDRRLARLPELLNRLLDDDHGLSADELSRLRAFVPRLAEVCAELAAFGVPETIQHDDLHDGQAFVRGDSLRVLDWGDSCVSHPFATLLITLDFVREDTPFDADALRRHYLSAFGEPDALVRAAELAEIVGAVTRALKWAPIVAHLGRPPELRDHVARRLRLLVDG